MQKRTFRTIATLCIAGLLFVAVAAISHAQETAPAVSGAGQNKDAKDSVDKSLSGFQGVKWGATIAEARTYLVMHDIPVDEHRSTETLLYLFDAKIAGYKPDFAVLQFGAEGFCQARVMFGTPEKNRAVAFFNEVKEVVKQKYGKPKADTYRISSPYEKGDGFDELAITEGKAVIVCLWQFKEGKEQRALAVRMNDDLHTFLVYEDTKRTEKEIERDKAERAKKL